MPTHGRHVERPGRRPKVVVIVVSFESAAELAVSLPVVLGQPVDEVIVVDNDSQDGSAEVAARWGATVVRSGINDGFGAAANRGARATADADVLVFVNPDAVPVGQCLGLLAEAAWASGGVAGPVVRTGGAKGQIHRGTRFDILGMPIELVGPGRPLFVQGCTLAIDARLFRRLGGFDDRYFLFAEDAELCLRALRAGADVAVVPDAVVEHSGGATVAGGYVRGGRRQIADLRFGLRERNTLALMISDAPAVWLVAFVPLHVSKVVALAIVLRALGRRQLSSMLLEGLRWNYRERGRSLDRRRALIAQPGWWRELRGRVVPLALVGHVRRDGWPTFIGAGVSQDAAGNDQK